MTREEETLEQFLLRMHQSQVDFDQLASWYLDETKQNQRLRGALKAYESECLCRVTDTRCERCKRARQALEGETK